MASYDFWKLQSPPEQDESKHGCWDCGHMCELGDEWICCLERDKEGVEGERVLCTQVLEYVCLEVNRDWEEV